MTEAERPADPLWDALVRAVTGRPQLPAALPRSDRGRWNRAVKELREIGATPLDVEARVRAYRRLWPGITVTPTAVVSNWTTLGAALPPAVEARDLDADAAALARTYRGGAWSEDDLAELVAHRLPPGDASTAAARRAAAAHFTTEPERE